MLEEFDKYVSNYDLNEINIKSKYNHSYRVMKLSEKYAKALNFDEEDIEIAKIIGLLHDLGRFEQYKRFHSFDDLKTIDHADYSVDLLFEKGYIEKFKIPKKYYDIVKFAIENHNKLHIKNTSNPKKLMHAKLIRDTDKIDILHLFCKLSELKIKTSYEQISKEVSENIKNHQLIDRKNIKNTNDGLAVKFAFTYDINNDICLNEVKENLIALYQKINQKEIFKDIYLETLNYLNERIDKNA